MIVISVADDADSKGYYAVYASCLLCLLRKERKEKKREEGEGRCRRGCGCVMSAVLARAHSSSNGVVHPL